jgi:hypothetical protein
MVHISYFQIFTGTQNIVSWVSLTQFYVKWIISYLLSDIVTFVDWHMKNYKMTT